MNNNEKQLLIGFANKYLAQQNGAKLPTDICTEKLFRVALEYLATPPAASRVPEWTNKQCMEFMSVAFRHNKISGDICMDDIRLGVKFALAAAPSSEDV